MLQFIIHVKRGSSMLSFCDFDWSLSLLHTGSYLNVDDIIASSEYTSCYVRVNLPSLAPLLISDTNVSSNKSDNECPTICQDIAAGSKIEIPVWLALAIGSGRRQIISIDLPPIYREAFNDVFEADPCVVDLKRRAPMYYMLLCNLLSTGHNRTPQIAATAAKVLQSRLKMVMDASLNADRHDTLSTTSKFDNLEMALFRIGQAERLKFERWTSRHHEKIEPTNMVRISSSYNTIHKRSTKENQ